MGLLNSLSYSVCILYSYLDVKSMQGVDPLSMGGFQFWELILMIRDMISFVNMFKQSVLGVWSLSHGMRESRSECGPLSRCNWLQMKTLKFNKNALPMNPCFKTTQIRFGSKAKKACGEIFFKYRKRN